MALRLELDFDKKKEPTPVLDLSKFRITSRQEFDKACEKVPDFKIKPEKVRFDDVKIQESHFSFAPTRAEVLAGRDAANSNSNSTTAGPPDFPFGNPVPPSMRAVRIEDLSSVDINWRMLTLARPKTKLEEDVFSRLVALDKMKRKTRQAEGDQVPPQKQIVQSKGSKGKKGPVRATGAGGAVPETRFPSCKECGDELCSGGCKDFHYDASERIVLEDKEKEGDKQEGLNLTALLEGAGGGSTRKSKKAQSTKGGPPRMSHFTKKKRKKKDSTGEKKKKSTSAANEPDDVIGKTVINGTTVLPKPGVNATNSKNKSKQDNDASSDEENAENAAPNRKPGPNKRLHAKRKVTKAAP